MAPISRLLTTLAELWRWFKRLMGHYDAPLLEPPTAPVQESLDDLQAQIDTLEIRVAVLEASGGGGGGGGGSGLDGVYDVTAYGATGDGTTDDRASVQAAIDAAGAAGGGIVYFPPGTYKVNRNASNIWCLRVNALTNITFLGLGDDCVIKTGTLSSADLHTIFVTNNSTFIKFYDLQFDGGFPPNTSPTNTTEQAHIIRLGGGNTTYNAAQDVTISRCHFRYSRGDAINGIGVNNGVGVIHRVKRVRISDCTFYYCHRSGVGIQRVCEDWHIHNNHFYGTNDQDIDMEPTGNGETIGFKITDNTFDHSARASGGTSVTLTGVSSSVERHKWSVFADNTLINGVVQGLNVDGLIVANNQIIIDGSRDSSACLYFYRRADNLEIVNNHVVRGWSGYSPDLTIEDPESLCLSIDTNGGVSPRGILVSGNTFEQYAPTTAIRFDGVSDLSIVGNRVIRRSNESNTNNGIGCVTTAAATSGLLINANQVRGNQAYATLSLMTKAYQDLTLTGLPTDGQTLTIAGQVYTFRSTLTPTANEILIDNDADPATAILNTIKHTAEAVTLGGGNGIKYAASTVANTSCFATRMQGGTVLRITARAGGTAGNSIAVSETMSNATLGGATLAGGAQTGNNIDCTFRAREPGTAGNSITIATVADGASAAGNWTASGTNLTYHYQSGVSTLEDMIERMRTDSDVNTLIDVEDKTATLGTPANVLTAPGDTFSASGSTTFSGGGGSWQYGILAGGANTHTDLVITNNDARGVGTAEIRIHGTVTPYPIVMGNNNAAEISAFSTNAVALVLAGNQYRALYQCTGSPESQVTANPGSLCVASAGGMDTTLYIKETGSGNTGWVAVQPSRAYGGFYFSTPAATTLAAATPAKASGTTTALSLAKFTMPASNRLTYTGTATRLFHVKTSVTVIKAASTGAALASLYLAKNGSVITGAQNRQMLADNTTAEYGFDVSWVVSLATNDYLELFLEEAGGDDMTVQLGQLIASAV